MFMKIGGVIQEISQMMKIWIQNSSGLHPVILYTVRALTEVLVVLVKEPLGLRLRCIPSAFNRQLPQLRGSTDEQLMALSFFSRSRLLSLNRENGWWPGMFIV
jgi:hypothetical protein